MRKKTSHPEWALCLRMFFGHNQVSRVLRGHAEN
jgi:hypothetical protein